MTGSTDAEAAGRAGAARRAAAPDVGTPGCAPDRDGSGEAGATRGAAGVPAGDAPARAPGRGSGEAGAARGAAGFAAEGLGGVPGRGSGEAGAARGAAGVPAGDGGPPVAASPSAKVAGRRLGRLHVLVSSVELARAAVDGGAPTLQVRVKSGSDRERFRVTSAIADLCRTAGVTCLVNDRADLAVAAGAEGVHVGADDLPVAAVRRVVGPGALVGGTARDPGVARRLVADGASYLGVGPTYGTGSKDGLPAPLGLAGLRAVVEAVDVPVIAIAGITAGRVEEVLATGAWGVAVIGAVANAVDPRAATRELVRAVARAAAVEGVAS